MSALHSYGFPIMPDPQSQPGLHRLLSVLFAPPVTFVDPCCVQRPGARSHRRRHRAGLGAVGGAFPSSHIATSRGWSGASIVPSGGRRFVLVGGAWTVPMLAVPPAERQAPDAASYICSTWIGLDGQHRYLNSSLPQIGTMQVLTPAEGTCSALAFFQWWDSQDDGAFRLLPGLAVAPGDTIAGLLWVRTPTTVVGYLRNLRTNQLTMVEADAPVVRPDAGPEVQLTVTGANAEWVLERPTQFGSNAQYPFPDYGTATFSLCCAGAVAGEALQAVQERDLTAAEMLRLFDVRPDGAHTAFLSVPERVSRAELCLRYGGLV